MRHACSLEGKRAPRHRAEFPHAGKASSRFLVGGMRESLSEHSVAADAVVGQCRVGRWLRADIEQTQVIRTARLDAISHMRSCR